MKKRTVSLLVTALTVPGLLGGYAGTSVHASTEQQPTDLQVSDNLDSDRIISDAQEQQLREEADITKQQAINIAKDFVNLDDEFTQENVSFQTNWQGQINSVWTVRWQKQEDKNYHYVHVTLDANTGDIVGMNRSHSGPDLEVSYPPKVDRSEAKDMAMSIIEEQFPNLVDQVDYQEDNQKTPLEGNVVYDLHFHQTKQDIPFKDNGLTIRINGNGDFVGLDYRWDQNVSFENPDDVISKENATEKMIETLPLQLQYRQIQGMEPYAGNSSQENNQYALEYAYANVSNGIYFDAKQGTWVDADGNKLDLDQATTFEAITEQPLEQAPTENSQALSQQQAIDVFQDVFDLPEMELEHVNYREQSNNHNDAYWSFTWRDEENDNTINGRIDALTGEILNYSNHNYDTRPGDEEDIEQSSTYQEAKQQAIETVKQLLPWKTDQIALNPSHHQEPDNADKMREFTYHFQQLVNGIPVPNQTITVTINAENGTLSRFYQDWENEADFADPTNIISEQQAKQIYLDAADIQLEYVTPQQEQPFIPVSPDVGQEDAQHVKLAYTFDIEQTDDPIYLDAVEGNWLSARTGEPVADNLEPTDLTGHWAEEELRLMLEYQALNITDDGKVNPNKTITRGEVVKMMMLSTNPNPYYYREFAMSLSNEEASFDDVSTDSTYFPYVESAVREGWIDGSQQTFNPDEPVTREELASMIVRALGYEELAEIDEMFVTNFNDIDQADSPGVISIISHLEIMNGSDGNFRPQDHATRAHSAKAYYEYLKTR
ncbi:YcdB/YcdC domain-containing protein [Aquibacillus sediminis]|uniref:YcdB/YcdC domain-containing protein n=1 Tax=Aquibacillus sediminis TaxID=2574734 RepID=UPI0011095542|nr:S-layer homology domain-containing protein [Aquibacillus sediminis]